MTVNVNGEERVSDFAYSGDKDLQVKYSDRERHSLSAACTIKGTVCCQRKNKGLHYGARI